MAKLAELFTELTVRDRKFKRGMKGARQSLAKTAASLKAFAVAAAASLAVAVLAVRKFLTLLGEQEKAEAKLAAVVKATGRAAGFTAEELFKQAAALQAVTTFGDEVIISGQAILATFKQIGGPQFTRATEAVLDMATVMDQDLRSVAIQVGKALNDPILGVTALGRAGVQFTEVQKKMIKTLVESGKTIEAQRLILRELESQFGGAARAASETFTGSMKQLKNSLGDVGEEIGKIFVPFLQEIGAFLKEILPDVKAWIKENKEVLGQMVRLAGTGVIITLKAMAALVAKLVDLFDRWAPAIERVVNALLGAGERMGVFAKRAERAFKATKAAAKEAARAPDQGVRRGRFVSPEERRRTQEIQRGRRPGERFEPTVRKGEREGRAAQFTGIADLFKQVQLAALNRKRERSEAERLKLQRQNVQILEQIRGALSREGGAVTITP